MMGRSLLASALCLTMLVAFVAAKDKKDKAESLIVMLWPDHENPVLKVTFERFNQLASYNGQLSLESHVLVENLSGKRIPQASFTVYLTDKDKVRVGNGMLGFNDLEPGQQVKLAFQVFSTGVPTGLSLVARDDASGIPTSLKTVPLKIISVPPGATLKVDGRDEGITPATVGITIGKHILAFSKDGYASGNTPVEIKPDEAPGGSITFELGGLSRDNLELRDGTVVQGDVLSLSMSAVVVRVEGKDQTYDRNQVQKILLVQRETVHQPVAVQPASPQTK
jgi:PEGA domain-containing protein